jgi:hypothetical protein
VELFETVRRRVGLAALGGFDVLTEPAGARVFVDDRAIGAAPVRVRVVVGRHVVRVEADGYKSYGAAIDVLEGERPAFQVHLSEDPRREAVATLTAAGRSSEYAAIAARMHELAEVSGVTRTFVVEVSARGDRALIVRCEASACRVPMRQKLHARLPSLADLHGDAAPLSIANLTQARRWLEPAVIAADLTPWWRRWYVVGAAGVLVVAAASAVVLAIGARSSRAPQLAVTVDPRRE